MRENNENKRCADCVHVRDERDPGDSEASLRCACRVPSWVPRAVQDYGSWVMPDDGENCRAFMNANAFWETHEIFLEKIAANVSPTPPTTTTDTK